MATNHHLRFLSDVPYSLFQRDFQEGSLHDLTEESKTFLWHQFILDVLTHIPRSSTDIENIITACRLVNEHATKEPVQLTEDEMERFRRDYRPDTAIYWYIRDSFFYRAFNKACRMLDSDAMVLFHPVVKDLETELKHDCSEQLANGKLKFPLTVYRGQTMGLDELEKIQKNIGGLISMHTFLSTARSCATASGFHSDADPTTAVIFEITVNKTEQGKRMNRFSDISQKGEMKHEGEVLFGVSSVFRIVAVDQWETHWYIELESTSCDEDSSVQKFMNEVRTYVHQNSGRQLPMVAFKELLTIDSLSYARPFIELMRFFVIEIIQLFLVQMYNKEGRMKTLIDNVPDLHELITTTNTGAMVSPNSKIICLFIDMLHTFLYPTDDNSQYKSCFDNDDSTSLLSFGGFLLLTGDLQKGTRYFQMLLDNQAIDSKLKLFIHGILAASYGVTKEKELAAKSIQILTDISRSSTAQSMPGWFPSFMASSYTSADHSDPRTDDTVKLLEPMINQEQSDNMVDEKLRLIHVGHVRSEQENFVEALNHWEEAAEIESHMPSSSEMMFNGAIYVQMAVAYLRLTNRSDALHIMEKAIGYLESYYPSTHRMFANLYFMYGFYLMQNDKLPEAIEYLKKSLENPYFSTNQEFNGVITTLLAVASIQSGDLDSAETYCQTALKYPSVGTISEQIPEMLRVIPQLRMFVQFMGRDLIRQLVGTGLQLGQQLIAQNVPYSSTASGSNDESTWDAEKFVTVADYYRHRRDNKHAEIYYRKALDRMTEVDSKSMWNVYRKMIRMGNQYRDDFIEQFSKYDDVNANHFSMITTLQIILYRLSLAQNEYEMAFDCLITGVLMAVKSSINQPNVDFVRFFRHESIAKIADMLIKMIGIYSNEWGTYLQQFLSTYGIMHEVAAIIQHTTIDRILAQMKSKYDNNTSSERIFQFLDIFLGFLRCNITSTETSATLSFTQQILKLLRKYNDDEESPWFYFIRAFESFCTGDHGSFLVNIEQFRSQTTTFQRYQELKEKISVIFERLDENHLYSYVQNFTKIQ